MKKFVMECPKCGNYVEASTGFFAKKKIQCTCGHVIDVKTEKMTSKVCAHCGNSVVYDQSKGDDALCPVCHQKLNTLEIKKTLAEFTCPSCGCKLSADKGAQTFTCPLCDTEINVQERIKKEEIKNKGLASIIKYEGGNDVFVWKHPIEDFNLGSQLIVHESQEAIFFKDGRALDSFGAGRYTLATQNLPLLENLYKLPTNADEIFHTEVYFVNMTTQMGIKWGTDSKVRMFDPASGLYVELGACGSFNIRVCDARRLLVKVVGTANELAQEELMGVEGFGITFLVGKFKAIIMNKVKANLARAIKENSINILEIDEYIDVISEKLKVIINETLEDYGLVMPEFIITAIMTPDDDPNFKRLKQQFADKTLLVREEHIKEEVAGAAQSRKMLEAQTEAKLKVLDAQGEAESLKIKAQAEADAYRAQAFAEADEMKAKGYTYQQETARKVGMEAMQNGITSEFGGGGIGDIAGLGVTLGAMGSVIGMTKDALNPVLNQASEFGKGVVANAGDVWDCPKCGHRNITSKFCPDCGEKRIEIVPSSNNAWTCPECGSANITSKFCPECGAKKPENLAWICPDCGTKDIKTKFCPNCGRKKGE